MPNGRPGHQHQVARAENGEAQISKQSETEADIAEAGRALGELETLREADVELARLRSHGASERDYRAFIGNEKLRYRPARKQQAVVEIANEVLAEKRSRMLRADTLARGTYDAERHASRGRWTSGVATSSSTHSSNVWTEQAGGSKKLCI